MRIFEVQSIPTRSPPPHAKLPEHLPEHPLGTPAGTPSEIPEFPTISLAVASAIGLMFLFQRKGK